MSEHRIHGKQPVTNGFVITTILHDGRVIDYDYSSGDLAKDHFEGFKQQLSVRYCVLAEVKDAQRVVIAESNDGVYAATCYDSNVYGKAEFYFKYNPTVNDILFAIKDLAEKGLVDLVAKRMSEQASKGEFTVSKLEVIDNRMSK